MGLKSFLEKIFGSGESGKSSAEQKARESMDEVREFTERTGKEVLEKTKPIVDKLQQTSEDVGKKVMDSGREFMDKAGDFTEDVGRKVLDATEQARRSMQDTAEEIGSRILGKDNPGGKPDSKTEGKETPEKEPFVPREDPFKKYEGSHERSSHMDALKITPGFGGGSFFDKAEKFASGDYDGVKDEPSLRVNKDKDSSEEEPKKPWSESVAGFEDRDGDGDPVIDDAIIIEDEEE